MQQTPTFNLSPQELEIIVENSPTLIWKSNPDKSIAYFSNSWLEFRGRTFEEEMINGWQDGVHPDDIEACLESYFDHFDRREPFDIKYRLKRHDGVYRWILDKGTPHYNDNGRFIGYFGYCFDITDWIHTQEIIEQKNSTHRLMLQLASSFINVPLNDLDEAISKALADFGRHFKVDRSYIFDYNWDKRTCTNTYEWCAEGIEPQIQNLEDVSFDDLSGWEKHHRVGAKTQIIDVSQLSPDKAAVKALLEAQDIKSLITLPLMNQGFCIGFIGFDSVKSVRTFTKDEEDLLILFAEMLVNIYKRKKADQDLIQQKELAELGRKELEEAKSVASLGNWHLDLKSGIVTWSKELFKMFGLDPVGNPPSFPKQEKLFSPESWRLLKQKVVLAQKRQIPYEVELNFIRADQSKGWMWAKGYSEVDENNKLIGLKGIAQDITKRKELEIQLKQSKARYAEVAKRLQVASASAGFGIFEWDIQNDDAIWDDRMFSLYDIIEHECSNIHDAWVNRIHPEDRKAVQSAIDCALENGDEIKVSYRIIRSDGRICFIKSYGHILRNLQKLPLRMIGVSMDVTRAKLHQRHLEVKNKQLVDFSNVLAHNLRAPIVNIELLADLIDQSRSSEEAQEYKGQLRSVLGHLNEVFDELMESIKIRQDLDVESKEMKLQDEVEKVLKDFKEEIEENGVSLSFDLDKGDSIKYPPEYLSSILHNLISNALKFRSPNRSLNLGIKAHQEHQDLVLAVTDNGLGLDMRLAKDNLFKMRKVFHKHPEARGFGLFLTKTQVEAMDGEIWVESEVNKGSTFYVRFKNAVE